MSTVLVLGGTAEAHDLAGALVRLPGLRAITSLAGATAQLSATPVDHIPTADPPLAVAALTPPGSQTDPVARFLCPDQGRAPPPTV